MPRFSLVTYFLGIVGLLSLFFLTRDHLTAFIYFLFFVTSIITVSTFKSTFYRSAYFVIMFSVFVGYFLRAFVLVDHPDLFMYPKISSATTIDQINSALVYASISNICLSIGFILVVKFFKDPEQVKDKDPDYMLQNFGTILSLVGLITLLQLFIILTMDAGVKNDANRDSTYAFVLKLLSPDISFVIYYVYITRYWKRLSLFRKLMIILLIALTSFSLLVVGSKAFVGMFALCFFFDFLYRNVKIKLSTFLISFLSGFIVLGFSFIISAAVKFSGSRDVNSIVNKAETFASTKDVLLVTNDITQRMMGLDGQIAANIIAEQRENANDVIKQSFSAKEIVLHTLNNIFPKIDFTYEPNSGKLISEYIVGLPEDASHAGALGLFASVFFIAGSGYTIFNFLLGIVIGVSFVCIRRIRNGDLKFILFFTGCYFILRIILSGNFDVVLGEFIPKVILLYAYIFLINSLKISKSRF